MLRSMRTLLVRQDRELLVIMLLAACCLTLLHYGASPARLVNSLRDLGLGEASRAVTGWFEAQADPRLARAVYWALTSALIYLAPLPVLWWWRFRPLRAYGLSLRREAAFWRLYAMALLVMVPLVFFMSATPGFQHTYPFFRPERHAGWLPGWALFEVCYVLQFLGLEAFFRGVLVHGLRPRLGSSAVAVMIVPYCMLHFGKPLPETLASIIAGLVLGTISYRSRSIALGFALHASVALLMDSTVLWRLGYFALPLW